MLRTGVVLAACLAFGTWAGVSRGEEAGPQFEFVTSSAHQGEKLVYPKGPEDKLVFKPAGRFGQITDSTSDKPVGARLDAGSVWTTSHPRNFSCWTFSSDGKYLVTGSSFVEESGGHGKERTDKGRVQVWDVASGKQVLQFDGRIGSIRHVALSADGKKIIYSAARYEVDGP